MRYSTGGRALTDLILETFRVNGRLLAASDRLTSPVGQTSARWQILGAIADEGHSVSQIARTMGLTRQSVQRTADLLQAEGLVAYATNPAHRRAKLVELTPRGRSVLRWITDRQIAWANTLAAPLGASELRRTVRILRALREALEESERKLRRLAR